VDPADFTFVRLSRGIWPLFTSCRSASDPRRARPVEVVVKDQLIADRAAESQLDRPLAEHLQGEPKLVYSPGAGPGAAATCRTLCVIGIEGMSAPATISTPSRGWPPRERRTVQS